MKPDRGPSRGTDRIYPWPPLPPDVYLRPRARELPFPVGRPNARVFARARHGLWHGLPLIGLKKGDRILVPAYNHGSEVEVIRQRGLEPVFYDLNGRLEPDVSELEAALDERVRALYLIHYFGIPQDADRWRAWCDHHSLLLLEDGAMSYLAKWGGRPVGSFGELAIFCLYKSFALPDGGVVVGPSVDFAPQRGPLGLAKTMFLHGSWVSQRLAAVASIQSWLRHARASSPSAGTMRGKYDVGDWRRGPSLLSRYLIPRIVDAGAALRRRRNHEYLVQELRGRVQPLVDPLPPEASPTALVFVVPPPQQASLHHALARQGVTPTQFWRHAHPEVPPGRFPGAASFRSGIVGLPVHQELRPSDLERVASAVLRWTPPPS